uniref:Uncharacterized protein n=1 Tax=Kalanchoe fedtschenkoi TaxID=63787 RepID=A0A7N0TNY9_KALFE
MEEEVLLLPIKFYLPARVWLFLHQFLRRLLLGMLAKCLASKVRFRDSQFWWPISI